MDEFLNLLKMNPSAVYTRDKSGNTALFVAVHIKSLTYVTSLLKYNADWGQPNTDKRTPISEAASSGFYEAVSAFLCTNNVPWSRTRSHYKACGAALIAACASGHVQIMQLLLHWGVDVNACDDDGCSPTMYAAQYGHVNVLQWLLAHGARANTISKVRRNALHMAAANGKACVVRFLCESTSIHIDAADKDGCTALFLAAENGHTHCVRELLRVGVDVDLVSKGKNLSFALVIQELLVPQTKSVAPHLESSNKRGMWAIPHSKIPAYLHKGAFYQSLDAEDESLVHVPFDCIRLSDQASNLCEFSILLRAMQFWVLDCIPDGVIEYCFYHEYQEWRKVAFSVLGAESFVYRDLCAVFSGSPKNALLRAIRANRVEIVRFLASVSLCASLYHYVTAYAARMGRVESLRALHECNVAWDRKTCAAAAAGGHLECLQYAHENGCDWDEATLIGAALYGRLDCLKYAFEKDCTCHPALCAITAQGGDLSCLQFLISSGWTYLCIFSTAYAAQGGHVESLRYLHEINCPWDEYTVHFAARAGKLATLRYALENGCPFTRSAVAGAAEAGSLSCLKYLLETEGIHALGLVSAFAAAMLSGNHECFAYLLRMGYRIEDFSFLSRPFTRRQRKCIAKANFDGKFSLCVVHAVKHGICFDTHLRRFAKMYNFRLCEELAV